MRMPWNSGSWSQRCSRRRAKSSDVSWIVVPRQQAVQLWQSHCSRIGRVRSLSVMSTGIRYGGGKKQNQPLIVADPATRG